MKNFLSTLWLLVDSPWLPPCRHMLWPNPGRRCRRISGSESLRHSILLCLYWASDDWCRPSAAIDSWECVPTFFTAICAFICRPACPLNGLGTCIFGGNNKSFFIWGGECIGQFTGDSQTFIFSKFQPRKLMELLLSRRQSIRRKITTNVCSCK